MTEGELVTTALATGAAAGLMNTGRGAVHDLCAGLREAVRRRLATGGGGSSGGGGYGVRVLDAYETDPDVWRTRLLQVLTACGADTDEEILAAARAVLRAERRTGHITVDASGTGQRAGHREQLRHPSLRQDRREPGRASGLTPVHQQAPPEQRTAQG